MWSPMCWAWAKPKNTTITSSSGMVSTVPATGELNSQRPRISTTVRASMAISAAPAMW